MSEKEIFELFIQMKMKKIKQKDLAEHLQVSCAWVCNFFALKTNMSDRHVQQLKQYIASK
ncbi:hypothetical protein [Paenisporosarcina sp. NPDC076898]|uniref:hypothetical protein n=1 Tax=unclassified Paenisporosarcina TaxID=2642018 RepID=UPI003D012A9B